MPLVFFPSAFLMSLSTSIVPAVSQAVAAGKTERLVPTLRKAFLFTILLGAGAASVCAALAKELGFVIYNQDISGMLSLLAFICPLWYVNITQNGVLNGLGAMGFIFRNNLLSSAVTIAAVVLAVPRLGITGFILGWFLGILLQVILGFIRIRKEIDLKIPFAEWLIKPGLAAAAAGTLTKLLASRFIMGSAGNTLGLIIALVILLAMYTGFILMQGVVTLDEISRALRRVLKRGSAAELGTRNESPDNCRRGDYQSPA
jgi:stage V sporulation protein B